MDVRKTRYQTLRQLGYSSYEAQKYRSYGFDPYASAEEINAYLEHKSKTINDKSSYQEGYDIIKIARTYDKLPKKQKNHKLGVYSSWGYITHDDKHKDETMRKISAIAKKFNITIDQAYHLVYTAYKHNITLERAKREIFTDEGVYIIS